MSADRVQVLEKLYEQGQGSELLDQALEKLFVYELRTCERQLDQLAQDLAEFEYRYSLSSLDFYRKFQAGEMGDAMDYVEWASLCQMARRLEDRIDLLKGTL
jgi:hypothetical protein